MAKPADFANTPPEQANAYGPGVTFTAAPGKSLSDVGPMPADGGLRQGEIETIDPKYRAARLKEMSSTGQ
jgi:hypothetical protein